MSFFTPAALAPAPSLRSWKPYALTLAFAAGNLLVPLAFHAVPAAGPTWLPLFWFTLAAGWVGGLPAAVAVALASPLANHFLVGMPTAVMLPVVLTKSLALGLASALWARNTRRISLGGLAGSVAAMQALGFLAERFAGVPFEASVANQVQALPGVAVLILGGYLVLRLTAGRRS